MIFGTYLLLGARGPASLEEMKDICEKGLKTFHPSRQKNFYMLSTEMIDDRFFWLSCDYDDANSYRDFVVNKDTNEREPNPKGRSQIELKRQFFACYDTELCRLYLTDINRKATLVSYFSDTIQKNFVIKNVYSSVDDFCSHITTIRGFRYTQSDNLFGRASDIFQQVGNLWGLDLPAKVVMRIDYRDIPVHQGRELIDRFHRDRDAFEDVVVIGCDDQGIEQSFDFTSVMKRIEIDPLKDANEQYDPIQVRELLLSQLRK